MTRDHDDNDVGREGDDDHHPKYCTVAGTFLTDYTNKSNLHIAVTDSRGEVVEFDQHGLHRHKTLSLLALTPSSSLQ